MKITMTPMFKLKVHSGFEDLDHGTRIYLSKEDKTTDSILHKCFIADDVCQVTEDQVSASPVKIGDFLATYGDWYVDSIKTLNGTEVEVG